MQINGDPVINDPHLETAGTVLLVAVPPAARALSTLSRVDYEDAFLLETSAAQSRTGEQWARASLGASSTNGGAIWRALSALGVLPRARAGPMQFGRSVGGWELRRSTSDYALVAASARIGLTAELLFKREQQTLLWATFVRLENPVAGAVWAGLAPVHRRVVSSLLKRVASSERGA